MANPDWTDPDDWEDDLPEPGPSPLLGFAICALSGFLMGVALMAVLL